MISRHCSEPGPTWISPRNSANISEVTSKVDKFLSFHGRLCLKGREREEVEVSECPDESLCR